MSIAKIVSIGYNAVMTFLLGCLFFGFLGTLFGFLVHIFNAVLSADITFDRQYGSRLLGNFCRVILVMSLSTGCMVLLANLFTPIILGFIGLDLVFWYELMYYLVAFAAFDFGLASGTHKSKVATHSSSNNLYS
jgi:hypothetical protein